MIIQRAQAILFRLQDSLVFHNSTYSNYISVDDFSLMELVIWTKVAEFDDT